MFADKMSTHFFPVLVAAVLLATIGCKGNKARDLSDIQRDAQKSIESTATLPATTDSLPTTTDSLPTTTGSQSTTPEDQPSATAAPNCQLSIVNYPLVNAVPSPLTDRKEQMLVRKAYTASYNSDLRLPNWVAWVLTAEHTQGKNQRSNMQFTDDADVPAPRAYHSDYTRSGYDRGHLCPAGDNKWDDEALRQTFLMTNICPQAPKLNKDDWNTLEQRCRTWAKRYGEVFVVSGPIMSENPRRIGKHKVAVPQAFFKVVLRLGDKPEAIGFVYDNDDPTGTLQSHVLSIDSIERLTGIDFFPALPDELEAALEKESRWDKW